MAKRKLPCCVCGAILEKDDAQFVDETTFAFYSRLPVGIDFGIFCSLCFETNVRTSLDIYNDKMERAKNINIFYLTQSKESRFVRRIEKPIKVEGCVDRNEAILRLAFLAVEAQNNSLVDVELKSTKVLNGRWQSSLWHGRAIPANIEESLLKRRFLRNPN